MIETFIDLRGWFFERLDACLTKRGEVATDETRHYLVELLSARGQQPGVADRPLVLLLAEASQADGDERVRRFRGVGDEALYTAGFFGEHLERHGIREDYVARLGGGAYETASRLAERSAAEAVRVEVYRELAERFVPIAHVLDDVRESTAFRTPQDIVRLYDRWRRTGSPRLAERLSEEGVFPTRDDDAVVH